MNKIPYKPSKKFPDLTKEQCDCLSYYYFSSCKQSEAFKLFIKPDTELGQRAMRAISSKELFDSSTAKKYLKALDDEVTVFLEPYKAKATNDEERKMNRLKRIDAMREKALGIIEKNLDDPEEAMDAVKILCKEFIDDENDNVNVPPQRYLPDSCNSCRYKVFCDEQCIDECSVCKFKAYANENGVNFDPQHQFDEVALAELMKQVETAPEPQSEEEEDNEFEYSEEDDEK
jgi:hypothetical protein